MPRFRTGAEKRLIAVLTQMKLRKRLPPGPEGRPSLGSLRSGRDRRKGRLLAEKLQAKVPPSRAEQRTREFCRSNRLAQPDQPAPRGDWLLLRSQGSRDRSVSPHPPHRRRDKQVPGKTTQHTRRI